MAEIVNCPQCARSLRVPDELLGQLVKCPTCARTFTATVGAGVPPPPRLPGEGPGPVSEKPLSSPGTFEEPSAPAPRPERWVERERDEYLDDLGPSRHGADLETAREMVSGPATAMLVAGVLGIALSACGLVWNLSQMAGDPIGGGGGAGQQQAIVRMFGGPVAVVADIAKLVGGIVVIVGAIKMRNLESYNFALTSAILTVIPLTMCCAWGVPIGIWALVVLCKPEVKEAFPR